MPQAGYARHQQRLEKMWSFQADAGGGQVANVRNICSAVTGVSPVEVNVYNLICPALQLTIEVKCGKNQNIKIQ